MVNVFVAIVGDAELITGKIRKQIDAPRMIGTEETRPLPVGRGLDVEDLGKRGIDIDVPAHLCAALAGGEEAGSPEHQRGAPDFLAQAPAATHTPLGGG